MRQGNLLQDSVSLFIDFTDGDGDIGSIQNDTAINFFIIDNRTNVSYGNYKLPSIPLKGANNGVEGRITINLFSTCCRFPENIPPCEKTTKYPKNELSFSIYIKDRAGNRSNTVKTTNIDLLCI
jgi:hypothetical protein